MPAVTLPPIRRLIRPDLGMILIEADFERADAQIVAAEAREPELLRIFATGHDIHTENAAWLWRTPAQFAGAGKLGVTKDQRQRMKSGVHLTNYGGRARTLGSTLGVTTAQAEEFQAYWFGQFPGIKRWHTRIDQKLRLTHCIHNVWGFRRFYFDRPGTPTLLPQALAWLGQSGVAGAINKAMLRVHRELPEVQLLLQIHDSLLVQAPAALAPAIFPRLLSTMEVSIPFDPPLVIPLSIKWSATSWGEMQPWSPTTQEAARAA